MQNKDVDMFQHTNPMLLAGIPIPFLVWIPSVFSSAPSLFSLVCVFRFVLGTLMRGLCSNRSTRPSPRIQGKTS